MFCPKCGHNNMEGAGFCNACGNALATSQATPQQAPAPAYQQPPQVYQPPQSHHPPHGYQQPPYGYHQPHIMTRSSGNAIAGFVLSFFCGLLGLIFSIIGYNECKASNGAITGEGLALAGIIISIVSMLIGLAAVAGG